MTDASLPGRQAPGVTGSLADLGVAELVRSLGRRRRTGEVRVVAGGAEVWLYVVAGFLVQGGGSSRPPPLGQLLLGRGGVTPDGLRGALGMQARAAPRQGLGRVLVGAGLATRAALAPCIEEQCVAVLARVLPAGEGTLRFAPGVLPPVPIELIPIPAERALVAASRRAGAGAAPGLPSPTAPLLVSLRIAEAGPLGADEERVVRALRDGAATLAELAGLGILDGASLLRTVVALRQRGLLIAGPAGAATR